MIQQQKHPQSPRSFWRRLIIIAIVVIVIVVTTVIWIESGQGPVATALSIVFVALAVTVSLLQWLVPIPSPSPTPQASDTDYKTPINIAQDQQQDSNIQFLIPQGPPFDETLLPVPEHLVGRDEDLRWLLERLRKGGVTGITAIRGMGGIGKTALAAVAVRRLRSEGHFQDGIAVVLCQELTDGIAVMRRILTRFDLGRRQPPASDPVELAELAHRMLHRKNVLIVLDNIEPELDIKSVITTFLTNGVTLLLTARQTLPSTVIPVEGSQSLDLLSPQEALDLFAQAFGRGSVGNLTPTQRTAAEDIVSALDRHTLAIKLAGAYAADHKRDLRVLAHEFKDSRRMMRVPDGQTPRAMTQIFARSIEKLPLDVQYLFAALSAFATTEFSRNAALALAKNLSLTEPEDDIDFLVHRVLIDASIIDSLPDGSDRERLRFHPLLRAFSTNILARQHETERNAICHAIARYYTVYLNKVSETALSVDEDNITGALEWAHEHREDELVVALCSGMQFFWRNHGRITASLRYLPWAIAVTEATASITHDREDRLRTANFALMHGQILEEIGRPDEAEQVFKSNLVIRRQTHDRGGEGEVLRSLGRLAQVRGRLDEADEYYLRALEIAQDVQNQQEESRILRFLGEVAQDSGRMEKAREYYQKALVIEREIQDRRGEGGVLRSLGELAWWNGLIEEAERYYQQALTVAREVQNRREEGWLLAALGLAFYVRGQMEEAEGYYRRALPIDREVQNRREEGWVLLSLGKLVQARGRLAEAEDYLQQSLAINREVQDQRDEAEVLRSLGELAWWRGQSDEAKGYLQQALIMNHELQNRRGEGSVLRSLGQIAQVHGHLEEAEGYLQQSLAINREVQDRQEEAEVLRSLGELAWRSERLDEAKKYLQQALTINRGGTQNRRGEGEVLHSLGEVAQAQEQMEEAKRYYQEALGIAREVENRRDEGSVLRSLGKLAQTQKRLKEAEGYYQRALPITCEVQNRREEGWLLAALGQIAHARGQPEEAESHYQNGLTILRDVKDTFNYADAAQHFATFLITQKGKHEEGCRMLMEVARYYAGMKLSHEQKVLELARRLGCKE